MIVTEALSEGWLKKHALVVKVARLLDPQVSDIGYYSTGFRIARGLRQSSDLEAYIQHLSRSVSVHARGAGADYHAMRGDWFELGWEL